jgi:hypothetical protein
LGGLYLITPWIEPDIIWWGIIPAIIASVILGYEIINFSRLHQWVKIIIAIVFGILLCVGNTALLWLRACDWAGFCI